MIAFQNQAFTRTEKDGTVTTFGCFGGSGGGAVSGPLGGRRHGLGVPDLPPGLPGGQQRQRAGLRVELDGSLMTRMIDTYGRRLEFGYDGNGRLATLSDGTGRSESFSYDAVGNKTGHVDSVGDPTGYAYDANTGA